LKEDPETRLLPVLVITTVEDRHKAESLGADAFSGKPVDKTWLLSQLLRLTSKEPVKKVLVVDDDEVSRYLLRQFLSSAGYSILEATNGVEAIRRASDENPDLVILDLTMPGMSGFEVLKRLKAGVRTRQTPVLIFTSRELTVDESRQIEEAAALIPKAAATKDQVLEAVRRTLKERTMATSA